MTGYTGISFPFRIGVRGGVVLSSTSKFAIPKIEESIIQILGTRRMERWMEYHIFSDLDTVVFEPNDRSLQTLFRHQLMEALQHDSRVKIAQITFHADDEFLWVDIDFRVIRYQTTMKLRVPFDRHTGMLRKDFIPMHDSYT